MQTVVIDAAHGGMEKRPGSKSSPIGVVSPTLGLRERDLTLSLARAVERRLGGGVLLTRVDPEENPTLAERAEVARRADADVLVSLHVNGGQGDRRGPETWIHDKAAGASERLGAKVQERLLTLRGAASSATIQRGAMAVLTPDRLGPRTAACLVEVDYLTDPGFERWIADERNVDAMGSAIADGVRAYLAGAYGARALEGDESDDYGIEGPIPDDVAEDPPVTGQGLARGLATGTDYPAASRFLGARAGHFRTPASPRAIERVVIHITDGTTTEGVTSWFRSAKNTGKTSSHYVVGQDGEVIQMVRDADIAHHAGSANGTSIGIEHVAMSPATAKKRKRAALYPSDAQYCASAALVTWLCDTYGIPVDRTHILGHSEAGTRTTHSDCPNSVWDWDHFMGLVTSRTCSPRTPAAGQGYGGGRAPTNGAARYRGASGFAAPAGAAERYGRATKGRGGTSQGQEWVEVDLAGATSVGEVVRRVGAMIGRQVSWTAGVPDTSFFPFSAVCQLQLWDASGNGPAFGTGFYIGREKILSCGHNFYGRNDDGSLWEATKVLVQPGHSTTRSVFDEREFAVVGRDLVHPKWRSAVEKSSRALGWDLSVLKVPGLPAPNGDSFELPNVCPVPQDHFVVGFGKLGGTTTKMLSEPMRCDGGPVTISDDELLNYAVNTKGGNSGSPVFINDGSCMVVAVHTGPTVGAPSRSNRGVYLGPDKVDWINGR